MIIIQIVISRVEDGEPHFTDEAQKYDEERTKYFESLGLRVVRFENQDVLYNTDFVLEKIAGWFSTTP